MSDEWPFRYKLHNWTAEAQRQDDGTWQVAIFDARRNPKRGYMSTKEETEQEAIDRCIELFKAGYNK